MQFTHFFGSNSFGSNLACLNKLYFSMSGSTTVWVVDPIHPSAPAGDFSQDTLVLMFRVLPVLSGFPQFAELSHSCVGGRVTERVLRADKTHSTGLTMSDPDILVQHEPSLSQLSSHAWSWRQNTYHFGEIKDNAWKINLILTFFSEVFSDHLCWHLNFS